MFLRQFGVIKYAPKVQTDDGVVPDLEAQPTEDSCGSSDHWADLVVTCDPDNEETNQPEPKKVPKKEWYVCNLCPYRCIELNLLMKHMMRRHTFIDKEYFVCGFCKCMYTDEDILVKHLFQHVPEKQSIDELWTWNIYGDEAENIFGKVKRWSKKEKEILEEAYKKHPYVDLETKFELAAKFKVGAEKIEYWFKNRRCSERRRKSEL